MALPIYPFNGRSQKKVIIILQAMNSVKMMMTFMLLGEDVSAERV